MPSAPEDAASVPNARGSASARPEDDRWCTLSEPTELPHLSLQIPRRSQKERVCRWCGSAQRLVRLCRGLGAVERLFQIHTSSAYRARRFSAQKRLKPQCTRAPGPVTGPRGTGARWGRAG